MKQIFLSLALASFLYAANDTQAIVSEVTKLRKKYEECKAGQSVVKGIDPKVHEDTLRDISALKHEIGQKEGVIRSMEQTLASRDRAYREMVARNKSLIQQIRSDKVSRQERESLKQAVIAAKAELALAKKELSGGSASVVQMRRELNEAKAKIVALESAPKHTTKANVSLPQSDQRISALQAQLSTANLTITALKRQLDENSKYPNTVTKVAEPTDKIKVLQTQLAQAQATIANLRSTKNTPVIQEKIVEKIVYKDRIVPSEKVVTKVVESTEKIKAMQQELVSARATIAKLKLSVSNNTAKEKVIYKDRPVEKVVEKVVYKDRPVEKVVEKIVYKDRPVEKVVEKIVYKDRPVEKVVEKIVYKDRPVEKVVEKVVYKDRTPVKGNESAKKQIDETTQRRIDKLALELERAKSSNTKVTKISASPVTKTEVAQKTSDTSTKKSAGSSAYRMATNAPIYSSPYGRQVDTWEARRSFTAGAPTNGWVHITGYFVNRVWQPTQEGENLYVKESDVIRR